MYTFKRYESFFFVDGDSLDTPVPTHTHGRSTTLEGSSFNDQQRYHRFERIQHTFSNRVRSVSSFQLQYEYGMGTLRSVGIRRDEFQRSEFYIRSRFDDQSQHPFGSNQSTAPRSFRKSTHKNQYGMLHLFRQLTP